MSLATINVTNVTSDKFEAIQESATKEFKGHFTQATVGTVTAGTIQDHGCTVDYSWDSSTSVLTFDVMALGRIYFHKISIDELKKSMIGWVEEVIAAMPTHPVGETVPKPESVIPTSTTTEASAVPPAPTSEPAKV